MHASDLRSRLLAILAADVAGYSRLMSLDDRATVAALDAARAVYREQISAHGGRVIDTTGDSVLAAFDTAAGAVNAALAVQRQLTASAADLPEERRMRFRIGVHLGDVIEKADGTVYGDGVNIAARLEGLAEPGGIAISDAVRGAVRGKVMASFVDQGEQTVKNIPEPVRAFRVTGHTALDAPTASSSAPEVRLTDKPSLAVLPFTNMSGDPEQDYFADGITEDVITDVSKVPGLLVIARNSSFVFKKQDVDIKDIGRRLGVRHVLEGSVRKVGMKVRINAQLIDAESGGHIWAERFDRDLNDIFALQDEVTRRIVDALKVTLGPAEQALLASTRTRNVQAHDCFLRGRELMVNAIGKDRQFFDQVVATYRRAIELDPGYAEPYGGLAMAYCLDFQNRWADTPGALDLAAHFAAQAIEKGPSEPYAHYAAAVVATWRRDLVRAKAESEEALALNANYALAYCTRGLVEIYLGHPLAAIPFIQRAILLDPVFTQQYLHFLGRPILSLASSRTQWPRFASESVSLPIPICRDPSWPLHSAILARSTKHDESGTSSRT